MQVAALLEVAGPPGVRRSALWKERDSQGQLNRCERLQLTPFYNPRRPYFTNVIRLVSRNEPASIRQTYMPEAIC